MALFTCQFSKPPYCHSGHNTNRRHYGTFWIWLFKNVVVLFQNDVTCATLWCFLIVNYATKYIIYAPKVMYCRTATIKNRRQYCIFVSRFLKTAILSFRTRRKSTTLWHFFEVWSNEQSRSAAQAQCFRGLVERAKSIRCTGTVFSRCGRAYSGSPLFRSRLHRSTSI